MRVRRHVIATPLLLAATLAINAKYAEQLENSGCTQVSEAQGCDITTPRADIAKAGFAAMSVPEKKAAKPAAPALPDAGRWVAKPDAGATVTTTRIQGDPRLRGENVWNDVDAKTQGPIVAA